MKAKLWCILALTVGFSAHALAQDLVDSWSIVPHYEPSEELEDFCGGPFIPDGQIDKECGDQRNACLNLCAAPLSESEYSACFDAREAVLKCNEETHEVQPFRQIDRKVGRAR